ncbi:hypothetical protein D9M68_425030 [compost metagenome]
MRKAVALLLYCATAAAEPTFIEKLDGLAAQCSIDGSRKYTEAELALRDHGEHSQKFKSALDQAYKASGDCVKANLLKGKAEFKAEAARSPHLKDRLADAYAAWVGYMEWLSTPHPWATDSAQGSAYEAARNRLQAEIDIQ